MNRAQLHKLIYLVLIAALLVPLSIIGRPATGVVEDGEAESGGKLARLREEYKLGQAQLGRIDPTSSAMRYLSLGMYGVAVCVLDQKASEYQKQEDWISLMAVLNQKLHLQPYYVNVWSNQSWNIAYNISSQWDDYHDKFYWVVRGIKVLPEGWKFNQLEPMFPYWIGWETGHKVGQSDEWREYRRLFRDDGLHGETWARWVNEKDNWLFGKKYLQQSQEMVDTRGAVLRKMGAEMFNIQVPIAQGKYAETIEREGTFGEVARDAWKRAHQDWIDFGKREFPSEIGYFFKFVDRDPENENVKRLEARLEELAPGSRQKLKSEKLAALPPEARRAIDTPVGARTESEDRLANAAEQQLFVGDREVAERAPEANRATAREVASQLIMARMRHAEIKRTREVFNYDYWFDRTEMETTDEALEARKLFYEAVSKSEDDPWAARKSFEEAFRKWRVILDKYPQMVDDQTAFDVRDYVSTYVRVLNQLDEPFDLSKFILRDLVEKNQR
jgi:hypothetical protein